MAAISSAKRTLARAISLKARNIVGGPRRRTLPTKPPNRPSLAMPSAPWEAAQMTYPVALYLQDAHDIRQGIELVQYAEAKGFDAVWQADSRLVRDAVVPMAAFAANTDRIKVGSGVIDIWTRNAARLASTFSTLDDLAPGRMICGLGAWWDPLAAKVGVDRSRPLKVMREVVDAVHGLLNNETVTIDGFHVQLDGVELDYVHQERRSKDVPIYVGATGMQMMELTGEIADQRGAELSRVAELQRRRAGGARPRCRQSRPDARRHRPTAARRVLRRRRPRRSARRRPSARDAVPRPTAPHHEGIHTGNVK